MRDVREESHVVRHHVRCPMLCWSRHIWSDRDGPRLRRCCSIIRRLRRRRLPRYTSEFGPNSNLVSGSQDFQTSPPGFPRSSRTGARQLHRPRDALEWGRGRMRKRERENPCGVCGHYHKWEQGEVCGVCGHRPAATLGRPAAHPLGGAFPSEILAGFLYLGSYDNACRGELLKTQGISRILNTVPACQNLYKNSFTYYCLQDDKTLQFDDAAQFLEQCEKDEARVLVHCMSGRNRSPAIVIAYLMKCRGWRLAQSLHWVKERRPLVELSPGTTVYQQLLDYEQKIFGPNEPKQVPTFSSTDSLPSSVFGFHKPVDAASLPTFNQTTPASIFNRTYPDSSTGEFVFRAGMMNEQRVAGTNTFGIKTAPGTEAPMDSC